MFINKNIYASIKIISTKTSKSSSNKSSINEEGDFININLQI